MKYLIVFLAFFFISCKKEEKIIENPVGGPGKVVVLNEGAFMQSNSSLTLYTIDSKSATSNDPYETINQKKIGDVLQSATVIGNYLYLIVNNSKKVEVIQKDNFQYQYSISNLNSPRYLLQVSSTKAYLSDLYDNNIQVIYLINKVISKKIECKGWSEEMVYSEGKVFVSNPQSDKLYVINPTTDIITDSISITKGGSSMQIDKNNKIWVLCGEDNTAGFIPKLFRINPITLQVEASFSFQTGQYPNKLQLNITKDKLLYLNEGVYEMNISDTVLSQNPIIYTNGKRFYGLGVNPVTGDIYVGDAKDFSQRGQVYRYFSNGTLIHDFQAGIAPSRFVFY